MPALNFQKQFAQSVENGEKRQTIRATWKDGRQPAKRGDQLALYTGMRTKGCRKLMDVECVEVSPVFLCRAGQSPAIYVDGKPMVGPDDFARRDGFESIDAMLTFFEETHGLPFQGWLIEWSYPLEECVSCEGVNAVPQLQHGEKP